MIKEIVIEEALALSNVKFVDVRSPGEFNEATIPGAINIPLLSDREREEVGTIYKQKSPTEAKKVGMSYVAPKLPLIIDQMSGLSEDYQLVVLCWRGGMRSLSVSLVLQMMGFPVYRLVGGYKAYRRHVLDRLEDKESYKLPIVLHGLTGVGKTEILSKLIEENFPVLDIEAMACNRGSVFGWIGQQSPPSQKSFDSSLLNKLNSFSQEKCFFVECESKKVGKIYLPNLLAQSMQEGKHVLLYSSIESRIERLVKDYAGKINNDYLISSTRLLVDRLGKDKVQLIEQLIHGENYEEVARILLVEYYDPLYKYPSDIDSNYCASINTDNLDNAVQMLKDYYFKLNQ